MADRSRAGLCSDKVGGSRGKSGWGGGRGCEGRVVEAEGWAAAGGGAAANAAVRGEHGELGTPQRTNIRGWCLPLPATPPCIMFMWGTAQVRPQRYTPAPLPVPLGSGTQTPPCPPAPFPHSCVLPPEPRREPVRSPTGPTVPLRHQPPHPRLQPTHSPPTPAPTCVDVPELGDGQRGRGRGEGGG